MKHINSPKKMPTMMEGLQDYLDWEISPIKDNPSWQSFNQANHG